MRRPSVLEYARLSEAIYGSPCPYGWRSMQTHEDLATDCHAAAYQHSETGLTVIAYKGTCDFKNLLTDCVLLLEKESSVFLSAFDFYTRVHNALPKKSFLGLTGHSLGGALAAFVAFYARHTGFDAQAEAHVFNAVPIASLLDKYFPGVVEEADYVTNYDDSYDVVSHLFGKKQFGTTYYVHEPEVYKNESVLSGFMERMDFLSHHSIGHLIESFEEDNDAATH